MSRNVWAAVLLLSILFLHTSTASAQEFSLSDAEKEYLLNLSRQVLCWYVKDGSMPAADERLVQGRLSENMDCFVTLDKKGSGLRGCMGFAGLGQLYRNVMDRTVASAARDPRFRKVQYEELRDIKIEISIMTAPRELQFGSPEDLVARLRPMVDGVVLFTRYGASTYIPKVWETIPDKEVFLSSLCMKHGAPADTWKKEHKNMRVLVFQALAIEEEEYGRRVIGKKGAAVGKGGASFLGAVVPSPEGRPHGGRSLKEGTLLDAGMIVSRDSDIIEE